MDKHNILKILSAHKNEFSEKFGVKTIGLFGSFANDNAVEESDIDIFVEMPPKYDCLIHLQDELEQLLHHKIDLIRLRDRMNPRLKENIVQDGLYA